MLEQTLNEALREVVDEEIFCKVQKLSYGQHGPEEFTPKLGLPANNGIRRIRNIEQKPKAPPSGFIHQNVWVILAAQAKIWPYSIARSRIFWDNRGTSALAIWILGAVPKRQVQAEITNNYIARASLRKEASLALTSIQRLFNRAVK